MYDYFLLLFFLLLNRKTFKYIIFFYIFLGLNLLFTITTQLYCLNNFFPKTILCGAVPEKELEFHLLAHYYEKPKAWSGFIFFDIFRYYSLHFNGTYFALGKKQNPNNFLLTVRILEKMNLENILNSCVIYLTLFLWDFFDFVFTYIEINYKGFILNTEKKINITNIDFLKNLSSKLKLWWLHFDNNSLLKRNFSKLQKYIDSEAKKFLGLDIMFKETTQTRNTQDIFINNIRVEKLHSNSVIGIFRIFISFFYIVFQYFLLYTMLIFILFKIRSYLRTKNNYIIQSLLNFVEYNTNNLSDLRTVLVSFSVFFLSFFCYTQLSFFTNINTWMVYVTIVFIFFSLSIPIFFILTYGVFFLVFISGVEKKTSYIKQLINDVISVVAFILRFVLQNMRLILIITYSWVFTLTSYEELNILINYFQNDAVLHFFLCQLKFIFEIIDVLMIFCVQLFAFVTVLTCLFSFVLVIEERFSYESFFLEKRKNNKNK